MRWFSVLAVPGSKIARGFDDTRRWSERNESGTRRCDLIVLAPPDAGVSSGGAKSAGIFLRKRKKPLSWLPGST